MLFRSMMAAAMSALDTEYNIQSAIFVNDVYHRKFRKKASDKELLFVGRLSVVVLALENIAIALMIHLVAYLNAYEYAKIIAVLIAVTTGVPLLVGIVYKKATQSGAILAIIIGFIWAFLHCADFHKLGMGFLAPWPFSYQWQAITTAGVSVFVMLLSGILPRSKADKTRSKRFFADLEKESKNWAVKGSIENVPIPFNIIGIFMFLIGVLLLIMALVEKTSHDQIFTGIMAIIIIGIGVLCKVGGRIVKNKRELLQA